MFVRFVCGNDTDNGFLLTGIITISKELMDKGELFSWESDQLESIYEWFNGNLPCPPFEKNSDKWTEDAVTWYKDDSSVFINHMWDIVAILRQHGVPVRLIKSNNPGKIVYEDEYQVVAETPKYEK